MNNKYNSGVEEQLHVLRLAYAKRLPLQLNQVREYWTTLRTSWDNATARLLHQLFHSLTGTSGSFGANAVSNTARALEIDIKKIIDFGRSPTNDEIATIERLLVQLDDVASRWTPNSQTQVVKSIIDVKNDIEPLIYIIENDSSLTDRLAVELAASGYRTMAFNKINEFRAHGHFEKPAAVIIDVVFPGNENAGLQIASELRDYWSNVPPIVVVSVRNDMEARLAAVRAGVTRYFTKPIDTSKLRQTLDGLTRRSAIKPYRVLIIEDDVELSHHYALILRAQGMDVRVENNPMKSLETLTSFEPELVLMDVYMPGCNGLEIASMIRQDDSYARMPIVFLSSETNLDRQMAAMNLGGDDFLTKPIEPDHLVNALTARLKRTRWIRRLNDELRSTLQESEFQRIALNRHSVVAVVNPERKIVTVNAKFCELSQYTHDEITGSDYAEICFGSQQHDEIQTIWEQIRVGQIWHGELCQKNKSGNSYWVDTTIVPFVDIDDKPYQYVFVSTDISGIKTLIHDLARAKSDAERANNAKSEFLSRMSHELRTPLNAILGFSQLLEVDGENPLSDSQHENVREIIRAGNHLLELINEVLDLARIEAGRMKLTTSDVDLAEITHDCISIIRPIAAQQNITINDMTKRDHRIFVVADKTRLTQIVLNLLNNAVKYNKQNGSITVSLNMHNSNHARLSIRDTGQGISSVKLSQLFEPFNRLGAETSAIEGTGIGLVIAKSLIELMNGKLGVASSEGDGSEFWIDLPVIVTQVPA